MNQLCVYILECSDNSYYTGVTNNIERRMLEHQSGEAKISYTFSRRPVKLKWYYESMDPHQAIELEKQIKRWTRKKKDALMNQEWDLLKLCSECTNKSSHLNYKSPFDYVQDDNSSTQGDNK